MRLPRLFWWLLAFLGLATGLLALGQRETIADPDSKSYGPSGTRAFAELLRHEGFQVRSEERLRFKASKDALLIGFFTKGTFLFQPDWNAQFLERFHDHVAGGGRALAINLSTKFADASRHALNGPATVTFALGDSDLSRVGAPPMKVHVSPGVESGDYGTPAGIEGPSTDLWWFPTQTDFAWLVQDGEGQCLMIADGLGATNRFIDKEDNAAMFLWAVRSLARPGGEIVFLEAAHQGADQPGLTEALGPWAVAGLNQLYFLFAVIVFTLGKRFGLPSESRPVQKGAKELAAALAGLLSRSRATDLALHTIAADTDRRIRRKLKLPRDASASKRDERIPSRLAVALRTVEALEKLRPSKRRAADAARDLTQAADEFLGRE